MSARIRAGPVARGFMLACPRSQLSISVAQQLVRDRQYDQALLVYMLLIDGMSSQQRRAFQTEYYVCLRECVDNSLIYPQVAVVASGFYENVLDFCQINAQALFETEHFLSAVEVFKRVAALSHDESDRIVATHAMENCRSHLFDQWHWKMLNDGVRNRAFYAAIHRVIGDFMDANGQKLPNVLDLGCGTGILSLFAEWAMSNRTPAAVHIDAVDSSATFEQVARAVLRRNRSLSSVHCLHSKDFKPDHRQPFQLCVSETLDCAIFGERICSSLLDVQRRLAHPANFTTVPRAATLHLALVQSARLQHRHQYLTADYAIISQQTYLNDCPTDHLPDPYDCEFVDDFDCTQLSDVVDAYHVNFMDRQQLEEIVAKKVEKTVTLEVKQPGKLTAVVAWMTIELAPGLSISTAPGRRSCWPQAVFPLYPCAAVQPGQRLRFGLCVRNERTYLRPLDLPHADQRQPLRASADLDFRALNNAALRAFFAAILRDAGPAAVVVDATDLAVQGDENVTVHGCAPRPVIRYISSNPRKPDRFPQSAQLVLAWPFDAFGRLDQDQLIQCRDQLAENAPAARLAPSHLNLVLQAFASTQLANMARLVAKDEQHSTYCDVDMSPMQHCNIRYFEDVDLTRLEHTMLSEECVVAEYSLTTAFDNVTPPRFHTVSLPLAEAAQPMDGLFYWYEVEDRSATTAPTPHFSFKRHMHTVRAYLFDRPHAVAGRDALRVRFSVLDGQQVFAVPELDEPDNRAPDFELAFPRLVRLDNNVTDDMTVALIS